MQGGDVNNIFGAFDEAGRGMAQNFLNVYAALTDWSLNLDTSGLLAGVQMPGTADLIAALLGGNSAVHDLIQSTLDNVGNIQLNMGIPLALTLDWLGAQYFGANALINSGTQFVDALQAQDWQTAFTTLFTAPALINDAYLNTDGISLSELLSSLNTFGLDVGSLDDLLNQLDDIDLGTQVLNILGTNATVGLGNISVLDADGHIPLGGLLASLGNASAEGSVHWSGASVRFPDICIFGHCSPNFLNFNIAGGDFSVGTDVEGTPTGGLMTALLNWMPHQLAGEITGSTPGSWQDIFAEAQELFAPDRFAVQIHDLFAQFGMDLDTSWLDPTSWLDLSWLDPATWLDVSSLAPLLDPVLEAFDPSWTAAMVPELLSAALGF